MNTSFSESVQQAIESFAKQNKISRVKLELFTYEIIALAGNLQQDTRPAGRKASQESLDIRQMLREYKQKLVEIEEFTVKELSKLTNKDTVSLNNAIRWLCENEKMFQPVGKKPRAPGERGKCEIIWRAVG